MVHVSILCGRGASYMLICYSGQPFRGPYDIKITARLNGHVVIAEHAIPEYFQPGALYESNVQLAYWFKNEIIQLCSVD